MYKYTSDANRSQPRLSALLVVQENFRDPFVTAVGVFLRLRSGYRRQDDETYWRTFTLINKK